MIRLPKLPSLPKTAAAAVAAVALLAPSTARAEASSWLFTGVGMARLKWDGQKQDDYFSLSIDTGAGTSPANPIIFGLGGRLTPYFGAGTDFTAYGRIATQGYVTGLFGVALDLGAYTRASGGSSDGGIATLQLGAPWGFVANVSYGMGSNDSQTMSAFIGIDFARLTVYRLSGQQQWYNENPPWRPEDENPQ